jgi:DNA-binding MarR family transcriptional regulator
MANGHQYTTPQIKQMIKLYTEDLCKRGEIAKIMRLEPMQVSQKLHKLRKAGLLDIK